MLAVALVDDLRCRSAEDLVVSRMDAGPEKTRQSIDLIRLHLAALCCSPGTRVVVGFGRMVDRAQQRSMLLGQILLAAGGHQETRRVGEDLGKGGARLELLVP